MSIAAEAPKVRVNRAALFERLGYVPHAGQLEIHLSPAKRRVVACGVRWGKTLCAAMEGLAQSLEPAERSVGWVVAPTYDLAERVYREIVVRVGTYLKDLIVACREHEKTLVIRNLGGGTSEIRAKSADNPISLLGEGLDWVIIDEAARLRPSIWESHVSQRLLDKQGWALLITTPRGKGWLYELYRRGQGGADPDYRSWNCPSWTNPHLSREAIERERARVPERVFRQEYGAEFLEGSGAVFRNVRDCATGAWKDPEPRGRYCGGLDLAKVEDHTVLVLLNEQREMVFADRFHRLDWDVQVSRVKAAAERYRQPLINVDSTGAGEPIYESLRRAGVLAKPYPLSSQSKSALVNNLAMLLEQKALVLPRTDLWPEGIDELESYEYSVTDAGTVRTAAPSGTHDDAVMALALAAWFVRPRPKPFAAWVG